MIFYKYTKVNNYSLYNLLTNSLYCAKQEELNDPYDSSILAKFSDRSTLAILKGFCNETETFKELNEKYTKFPDKKNEILKQVPYEFAKIFMNRIRICSLTKTSDNPLMWAHYANNYNGICIGYETEKIGGSFYIVSCKNEKYKLNKVHYNKNNGIFMVNETSGKCKEYEHLLSKFNSWKYEKEYRIITKDFKKNIILKENSIKKIIFGTKCDLICQNLIFEICREKNPNIEYSRITVGDNGLYESRIT